MKAAIKRRWRVAPWLVLSLLTAGLGTAVADRTTEQKVEDAWIQGKLETVYTLNRHLNPFTIDTEVTAGVVTLTGTVESDIDKDLAGELAKGIKGVSDVDNQLGVGAPKSPRRADTPGERDFGQWVEDATTTASVKSKLLTNSNTNGLKIDVDTRNDIVTLRGQVASDEERQLAEELARNTDDVEEVRNDLQVVASR